MQYEAVNSAARPESTPAATRGVVAAGNRPSDELQQVPHWMK
jgi:hypothetical protein